MEADLVAVEAALRDRFAIPVRAAQVVLSGSRIYAGLGQSAESTIPGTNIAWLLAGTLPRDPALIDMGKGGASLADIAASLPDAYFAGMIRPSFDRNLWYRGGDINGVQNGMTVAAIEDCYRTLIGRAQAAGVAVVLGTIIPRAFGPASQAVADAVNNWLRDGAVTLGGTLVEYASVAIGTVDGVHPTAQGYAAMADTARPVLASLLA